jgi:hypothetical protein
MAGHTPAEAVRLAGSVFSICGQAQALAARAACEAAMGLESGPEASAAQVRTTLGELAREHAWRLLLNWPQETGNPPDMDGLLILRRTTPDGLAAALDGLLAERLLGEPVAEWLNRDLAGFDAWRAAGRTALARLFAGLGNGPDTGACGIPLLPGLAEMPAETIATLGRRALAAPGFCALPVWREQPAETGAVARLRDRPLLAQWLAQRGRGSGARMLARLVELAELASQAGDLLWPVARAWHLAQDSGVAGVETARGLLLHVVHLARGRIVEYRIVAPTEWNFHPRGPLVAAIEALPAAARLAEDARQAALSLDPCVAYGLEIVDA